MKTVSIKHTYWDIAADIYFPDDFNSEKKYPAIISAHPIGSCKEQTSGSVYGAALAKAGFIVIAFDASFQGSSGGEPRYLEDPTMRVAFSSDGLNFICGSCAGSHTENQRSNQNHRE